MNDAHGILAALNGLTIVVAIALAVIIALIVLGAMSLSDDLRQIRDELRKFRKGEKN